jgi:hypothetical protein
VIALGEGGARAAIVHTVGIADIAGALDRVLAPQPASALRGNEIVSRDRKIMVGVARQCESARDFRIASVCAEGSDYGPLEGCLGPVRLSRWSCHAIIINLIIQQVRRQRQRALSKPKPMLSCL